MFKGHMLLLYVGCMKFPINWFVRNFCPNNNKPQSTFQNTERYCKTCDGKYKISFVVILICNKFFKV
jgi:hypothetical protein